MDTLKMIIQSIFGLKIYKKKKRNLKQKTFLFTVTFHLLMSL